RYEFAASTEPIRSLGMLDVLSAAGPSITRILRSLLYPLVRSIRRAFSSTPPFNPTAHRKIMRAASYTRTAVIAGFAALLIYTVAEGMIALVRELLEPWRAVARLIPAAAGCSMLRLSTAYLISLLWTVPCA